MGDRTGIEWTDATWNPQVGCSRVSRGCQHCYAETQAAGRLRNTPAYEGVTQHGRFSGRINTLPERLDQPLRWQRRRRIFANSMSDLFHPNAEPEWIARVVGVMARAQWHTFQVLTKRPERMRDLLSDPNFVAMVDHEARSWTLPMRAAQRRLFDVDTWPLPNVWWGVSIEHDQWAGRADVLRGTPAAVRWISAEPLVGPLLSLSLDGIDWVVAGGESGSGAAPMHPAWVRDLRDRCDTAGVPFLFKQWGQHRPLEIRPPAAGTDVRQVVMPDGRAKPLQIHRPGPSGTFRNSTWSEMQPGEATRGGLVMVDEQTVVLRVRNKHAAGRELDGRTHDAYPPTR